MEKTLKQVCKCENCGNEAEMEVSCSWKDYEQALKKKETNDSNKSENVKVKGTGTCTQCGNEADMWIDV